MTARTPYIALLFYCSLAMLWINPQQRAYAIGVDVEKLADPEQEAQARLLMQELRCLVCQNQSIEDSNAPLAQDLRKIVRTRLAAGETPEQVKAYLVARYGTWVLLRPPLNPYTWLLWGMPALVLLGGGWIAWWQIQRKMQDARLRTAAENGLTLEEQEALKGLLDAGTVTDQQQLAQQQIGQKQNEGR